MTHSRIAADHPLVLEIKKLDPKVIPWVPHALKILGGLDARDEYQYSDIATMCGTEGPDMDPQVFLAAGVLASWCDAVLDIRLYMLHEGEKLYIDPSLMSAVIKDEDIPHPVTGETVTDPASKCYLNYKIRDGI